MVVRCKFESYSGYKINFCEKINIKQVRNKMILETIVERYSEDDILKADGFDEAVIGIDESSMRLIYSMSKCVEILMRDMSEEDALEYYYYNMSGAYVGEGTPIWCVDMF